MEMTDLIEEFEEITLRQIANLPIRKRLFFEDRNWEAKRALLIIGQRGVGKTTYLLSASEKYDLFYISTDHPLFAAVDPIFFVKHIFLKGYKGIIFDEVHNLKEWSKTLKALYDSYPGKRIWASDSSRLVLEKGMGDLSRRFLKHILPVLSLREYIHLVSGTHLKHLSLGSHHDDFNQIIQDESVLRHFDEYKKRGLRPFFLEGNYGERLLNTIDKVILADIPYLLGRVDERYLRAMRAMVGQLALNPIPTLNIEKLSTEWSLGKEKIYDLLECLQLTGLIHIVRKRSDKSKKGKGAKILFGDPSIYFHLGNQIGNFRESFFVCMMKSLGHEVYAHDVESQADYVVNDTLFEIGGPSKKRKSADIVVRDDTSIAKMGTLPLCCFGFLY